MSSISSTYANNSCIVACTSGSVTPCGAWNTIWDVKPACSGAFASSSSCTSFVSLAGSVKSVR